MPFIRQPTAKSASASFYGHAFGPHKCVRASPASVPVSPTNMYMWPSQVCPCISHRSVSL